MSEVPPSPGEHAIIHLLRAVRNPQSSSFHPLQIGRPRPRTMGPSSFSGGAPRDRRGRIAQKVGNIYDAVPHLGEGFSDAEYGETEETPTVGNGIHNNNAHLTINQEAQRLRDERAFLDSLRSPDVDRSMEAENAATGQGGEEGDFGGRFTGALAVSYDSANDLSEEDDFGEELSRVS